MSGLAEPREGMQVQAEPLQVQVRVRLQSSMPQVAKPRALWVGTTGVKQRSSLCLGQDERQGQFLDAREWGLSQ